MENLVPLGTGNSRFMKSNIPANTTLAQLIQMLNNGTFPYDVGTINPAGISQQGTPLNKATLLKDATAALFGLPNTAVPDDVLVKLANAAFVENGSLTDVGGNSVGVQIATGSYVGTGTYGSGNPTVINIGFEAKIAIITAHSDYKSVSGAATTIYFSVIIPQDGRGFIANFSQVIDRTGVSEDLTAGLIVNVSHNENTISLYSNSAVAQLNQTGCTYFYTALG